MIYDRVCRLDNYAALSPLLAKAIAYVNATDLATLTVGRHEIAGDDIFAAVHAYQTKAEKDCKFEAHRKYVDLQVMIAGTERMDVADIDGLVVNTAYDQTSDAAFYDRPAQVQPLVVSAGEFTLFFAHDAHAPSIEVGDAAAVKKVVLKIRAW